MMFFSGSPVESQLRTFGTGIYIRVMKTFKETGKDQDLMSEGFDLLGLLG
jgi:hypothetical protein